MARLSNAEIKSLTNSMQTAVTENRTADARKILEKLQEGVPATEEVIRATKVGQAVAKLKTCDDKALAQMAKEIVRMWKTKVDSQRVIKKKESPTASASPAVAIASPRPSATPSTAPASSTPANGSGNGLDFDVLQDKTRNACLKLIHSALIADNENVDVRAAYTRALEIEAAVFRLIGKGSVTADYRSKVRSLTLNLKDKKNPSLRASVVSGQLDAEKLTTMTAEEMASEEQRAEREALQMQNLFNAKGAESQEAETDAFQCGKCKQRKCRYYQKQTRSADEPMTTFVQCTNCGNRWRFC